MPAYITITDPETDPDAPLTAELAKKWRDNPIAVQEGDPTAPKVQPNAMRRRAFQSAAAAQTITFGSLDDFRGVEFTVYATRSAGGAQTISFQYSDNGGSTFSTAELLLSLGTATSGGTITGSFDFATGALRVLAMSFDVAAATAPVITPLNTNLAGASVNITDIRFLGSSAAISQIAHIHVNGGTG